MKKFLAVLLLFSGRIVIVIFAAELVVRFFFPVPNHSTWHRPDKFYGYAMIPHFDQELECPGKDCVVRVQTNSWGFRDQEFDLSRNGYKRILLLGDSFTFGDGINIEDAFGPKLEDLIDRKNGDRIQYNVLNTGVGGWGTLQEILFASDHIYSFRPDVIILTFNENDPQDDEAFIQWVADPEGGMRWALIKDFMRKYSHLYRLGLNKLSKYYDEWMRGQRMEAIRQEGIFYHTVEPSGAVINQRQWDRTIDRIRSFHRDYLILNPEGILMLQASNPWDSQIYHNLRALDNGQNLIFVDLSAEVKGLQLDHIYLPSNKGWTPLMHSFSAKRLFQAMKKLGLLDENTSELFTNSPILEESPF